MNTTKTTKAIRFQLKNNTQNVLIQEKVNNLSNGQFNLAQFVLDLDNFIDFFDSYLYDVKKGGDPYPLIVKNEWMKTYAKQKFAEKKKPGKRTQYTIYDYGITEELNICYDTIDNIYTNLKADTTTEMHERARRAHTAILLKGLYAKDVLPMAVTFVENSAYKEEQNDESLYLKTLGRQLLCDLELGLNEYLPEQSRGVAIAKATFNYYTLNKKPIDYDKKIQDIEDKLKTDICQLLKSEDRFSRDLKKKIEENIKEKAGSKPILLGDTPFADSNDYVSLRQILKNIKATQKAKFNEMVQKGYNYDDLLDSDLYLFTDITEDEFNNYYYLTEEIEELSTEKNQTGDNERKKRLTTKITNKKKERGALINAAKKETAKLFKTYKDFADIYKKVARNHGKYLAQLKGIEKERAESQLLSYWSMILEENGKYKLILIPKEKAAECKNRLSESTETGEKLKLYWFESFTYRSLQKLCFGNPNTNTFYQEVKKELEKTFPYDKDKVISGEHEFNGDEQKKIDFYKTVLQTRYAKRNLSLPSEEVKEKILDRNFENLDDFKIALEQVCYKCCISTNKGLIDVLRKKFDAQILEITSSDLRHSENVADKETVYSHQDKAHTQIWKQFWSAENREANFDIRINPEITIFYRKPKESRIAKYGKDSDRFDPRKNNRYLHEQYTLVTTISEHSNSPAKNLSFCTENEIKKMIDDFNAKVNKSNLRFAFGIDNGEVELSTLGVYLPVFQKDSAKEINAELHKVEDYGFRTLTIRNLKYSETDKNGKEKRIIVNPSYFLNEELYCHTFEKTAEEYQAMFSEVFEEKYLLSLDLSTAKVICGHIVTNGDIPSLFNLWMRHAQRNIFEMNEHAKRKGAKKIVLRRSEELTPAERRKFVDYINKGNGKYEKLSEEKKQEYVNWLYNSWKEYTKAEVGSEIEKIEQNRTIKGNYLYDVLMAVSFNGDELITVKDIFNIRNIFKFRKDFYSFKTEEEIYEELNSYNKRTISFEELDMKLNQRKASLVANAIGVIDFLYKQYKERFGGEGLVVKEGFDVKKVEKDREKFSGNIYRMLERKLYQKFQNYGLVPPLKDLLSFRDIDLNKNKNESTQIGHICFIDYSGTSQRCPACEKGKLGHTETCSENCGFESKGIMHSNDGIASYNIAKKGYKALTNK